MLLLWILLFSSLEMSKVFGVFKPHKNILFAVRTLVVNADSFILSLDFPKFVSIAANKYKNQY